MKTAAREITVYSSDGQKAIGALQRGEQTLVLGETGAGVVIAYIIGLVKPEDGRRCSRRTSDAASAAGQAARVRAGAGDNGPYTCWADSETGSQSPRRG